MQYDTINSLAFKDDISGKKQKCKKKYYRVWVSNDKLKKNKVLKPIIYMQWWSDWECEWVSEGIAPKTP